MSKDILKVAEAVRKFTYEQMMEVADHMSSWTLYDKDGNERPVDDPAFISRDEMAANLSEWAKDVCDQNCEEKE